MYSLKEHNEKKLVTNVNLIENAAIVAPKISSQNQQILKESKSSAGKKKLIVQMEGIHVGKTRNSNFYTEAGLKNGLSSWTHPFNKPVLTHHNQESGEPIGRILNAEFSESTKSGRKGIIFTVEITDAAAQEKVLDGRYATVSIGATTNKVTCNICGTDRTHEWCEHWKDETYEGQTCHFVVGDTIGQEVSYVNMPSDIDAGNISAEYEVPTDEEGKTTESMVSAILQVRENEVLDARNPVVNLYESASNDLKEQIDGFVKKPINKIVEGGSISMEFTEFLQEKFGVADEKAVQLKLTEMLSENETLKKDLSEAKAQVGEIAIKKAKVEESVQTLESEKGALLAEAEELKSQLHLSLVERVVNTKRELKKPDVMAVTVEKAVEEHAKRSKESLENTLTDLLAESKSLQTKRGSVENPGLSHTEEGENEESKRMSLTEGLSVLTNAFGKKK